MEACSFLDACNFTCISMRCHADGPSSPERPRAQCAGIELQLDEEDIRAKPGCTHLNRTEDPKNQRLHDNKHRGAYPEGEVYENVKGDIRIAARNIVGL